MKWFELRVKAPAALKEAVTNRMFELGARGISDPDAKGESALTGYFDEGTADEALREMGAYVASLNEMFPATPAGRPELAPVREVNWIDAHREFYKAQRLSPTFFLLPVWDDSTAVPEGMVPIRMDLGQAFGTGLHPSTQLALRLMERVVDQHADPGSLHMVDVGTGTGILSIAGSKLGVGRITALDIDKHSVEVARENLALNGCPDVELFCGELDQVKSPMGLIVSNILLEVHLGLVDCYRRLSPPGGRVILSGLLGHELPEVRERFEAAGFLREETDSLQEWSAVVYRTL